MQQLLPPTLTWPCDRLCYTQKPNGWIDTAYLGHTNKEKLSAWAEWLQDRVRSVRPSKEGRTGCRHELEIKFFGKGQDVLDVLSSLDLTGIPPRSEIAKIPLHGEKCAVFFPGDRVRDRGGLRTNYFTVIEARDSEGRYLIKPDDASVEHWQFLSAGWEFAGRATENWSLPNE